MSIDRPPPPVEPLAAIVDGGRPVPFYGYEHDLADHLRMIEREFSGRPILERYHADLIVRLRRRIDTGREWPLFLALWAAHGPHLLRHLDSRWLVAACDTIADHDEDPAERAAAVAASVLVATVKLYETERLMAGPPGPRRQLPSGRVPLFDGLSAFYVGHGDMIRNLLDRLDRAIDERSLAGRLLRELMNRATGHDSVLRRMAREHLIDGTRWARAAPRTVAFMNDTSTTAHFGCLAVMAAVDQLFAEAGLVLAHRQPVGGDWRSDPAALAAMAAAEIVVVNGEGSIHHDLPRARELAAVGPHARALGKPAFLINATLEEIDAAILADLAAFDGIWVREGASSRLLSRAGLAHRVCADLSFAVDLGRATQTQPGPVLVDSVQPAVNARLAEHAAALDRDVLLMKRADGRCAILGGAEARPGPGRAPCADHLAFAALIGSYEHLVTGRFHAACMAISLRLPFHAFASNTSKIEATLADVGLTDRMIGLDEPLPYVRPFSAAEDERIGSFIAQARHDAAAMASFIASV